MPDIQATRWYIKKSARLLAAAGGRIAGTAAPAEGPSLHVLTYHCFGPSRRDPFRIDPQVFERQIRWLAQRRMAVSLADVAAFLNGRQPLACHSVLVTIDDGDASVAQYAWPILRRHGVPAVAFIIAGEIGRPGRMTAPEIQQFTQEGLEIGSHSMSHPSMARIPARQAEIEAVYSRQSLESLIGRPVTAFAYPFGTRADYDDDVARTLSRAGYQLAFTSQHGAIEAGMPAMTLPRIKIEAGDPDWLFRSSTTGAMDGWRYVDQLLWRSQKPFAGVAATAKTA